MNTESHKNQLRGVFSLKVLSLGFFVLALISTSLFAYTKYVEAQATEPQQPQEETAQDEQETQDETQTEEPTQDNADATGNDNPQEQAQAQDNADADAGTPNAQTQAQQSQSQGTQSAPGATGQQTPPTIQTPQRQAPGTDFAITLKADSDTGTKGDGITSDPTITVTAASTTNFGATGGNIRIYREGTQASGNCRTLNSGIIPGVDIIASTQQTTLVSSVDIPISNTILTGIAVGNVLDSCLTAAYVTFGPTTYHRVSTPLKVTIDRKAPGVTITRPTTGPGSGTLSGGQTATITYTFDETVTGFADADTIISANSGTLTGWAQTAAGTEYTETYTAPTTGSGTATITVVANAATDAAGNNVARTTFDIP